LAQQTSYMVPVVRVSLENAAFQYRFSVDLATLDFLLTLMACILLPFLAALFRGTAGWELIIAGAGYSTAVNSFPDTIWCQSAFPSTCNQESDAVTLQAFRGRLRHAIYDRNCADLIVRWIDRVRARDYLRLEAERSLARQETRKQEAKDLGQVGSSNPAALSPFAEIMARYFRIDVKKPRE
jgi:hypothetical protein